MKPVPSQKPRLWVCFESFSFCWIIISRTCEIAKTPSMSRSFASTRLTTRDCILTWCELFAGAKPVTPDTEKRHAESPDQLTQFSGSILGETFWQSLSSIIPNIASTRSIRSASLQKGANGNIQRFFLKSVKPVLLSHSILVMQSPLCVDPTTVAAVNCLDH